MAKKEKSEFDGRIWPTILDFNINLDSQLTGKANFLFGAATLILMFVLNKTFSLEFSQLLPLMKSAWLVLLAGSFLSSLTAMMIVLPRLRIFSSKERSKDDVFYYKNLLTFYTKEQYADYLKDLPIDNARIGKAYASQIYSLATYVIPYKSRLLKISGWVLFTSIVTSIILFLTSVML